MCVRMRLYMRVCVCVCKAQCACDYRICACLRARGARCVGLRSGKLLSERRLARVRRDKLPTGTGSFKPVFKVRVRVCVECLFLRHRGTALYRANQRAPKWRPTRNPPYFFLFCPGRQASEFPFSTEELGPSPRGSDPVSCRLT